MLDEVERQMVGVLGAGQQRLAARFRVWVDDGACQVSFEDGARDLAPAAPRSASLAGEPSLQLRSEPDGHDRGDIGGFRHGVYSIQPWSDADRAPRILDARPADIGARIGTHFTHPIHGVEAQHLDLRRQVGVLHGF